MRKRMVLVLVFSTVVCNACTVLPQTTTSVSRHQPVVDIDKLNEEAHTAFKNGDFNTALELYEKVIASESWNRKANYNISVIHLELALKGFSYIGQFINDAEDSEMARSSLDQVTKNAQQFLSISKNYVRSN